jgi:hypothetical protein
MPSFNCVHPTCNAILPAKGYCPKHQAAAKAPQADYDKYQRDQWAKRFYNSARWIKARNSKLARFPMCERCKKALAGQVHHKTPVQQVRRSAPHLLYAGENLLSVCIPCHNALEKSNTLLATP